MNHSGPMFGKSHINLEHGEKQGMAWLVLRRQYRPGPRLMILHRLNLSGGSVRPPQSVPWLKVSTLFFMNSYEKGRKMMEKSIDTLVPCGSKIWSPTCPMLCWRKSSSIIFLVPKYSVNNFKYC